MRWWRTKRDGREHIILPTITKQDYAKPNELVVNQMRWLRTKRDGREHIILPTQSKQNVHNASTEHTKCGL